jgi:hypothetical protein
MADKAQPQELNQRKATEDDDVEGHALHTARASEGIAHAKAPAGLSQRKATEDDDVEGHAFNLRSPSSRGE